jgi:hypothetical protein
MAPRTTISAPPHRLTSVAWRRCWRARGGALSRCFSHSPARMAKAIGQQHQVDQEQRLGEDGQRLAGLFLDDEVIVRKWH